MARYVLPLFDDEDWFDADEQTQAELFRPHDEFTAAVAEAGASVVGGEGPERTTTATTVHRTGERPLPTDGPFVDIKEALGGFYVIDAPDLDVALSLARRCPAAHVEVRAVRPVPVASTARLVRDLDLAEDCAEEAVERALATWCVDGAAPPAHRGARGRGCRAGRRGRPGACGRAGAAAVPAAARGAGGVPGADLEAVPAEIDDVAADLPGYRYLPVARADPAERRFLAR